jgi:NAD(P)-dependent dehydrogenase (short-subunit alcohol dehydrogenase family)
MTPDTRVSLKPVPVGELDLKGRSLVVVGGTDGLGRAIAKTAAARGAQVTVCGRTFRDEGVKGITFARADLSSMKEAARIGRELPAADVFLFTTGIITAPLREQTAEGLERDLAVSYLSRLAAIRELAPRLKTGRIFVMGYPGEGQKGDPADLNAEREYKAWPQHMNTVAGNEVLVLDSVKRYPELRFFGLNPGLIKTNIRANLLGPDTLKHRAAELLIGLIMPSPEAYARKTVPILFAPELEGHSGAMFSQKGKPILPTPALSPPYVAQFIDASQALLQRALAA